MALRRGFPECRGGVRWAFLKGNFSRKFHLGDDRGASGVPGGRRSVRWEVVLGKPVERPQEVGSAERGIRFFSG